MSSRKLFCDIHPICFAISEKKEILKRNIKNIKEKETFSKNFSDRKLSNVISSTSSGLIKRGKGIDIKLQENKAVNIEIACKSINKMIIHPGETFSFWKSIGKTTKRKGYKDGRVLTNGKIRAGIGGGLCNLSNTINLLIMHSPLEVTEFHEHSDALVPDNGKRIPFSAGTSVNYNYMDFRFKNNTDKDVQLLLWCEDEKLYGELRCDSEFPYRYELEEKDHHFKKINNKYFRISKIYKNTIDKKSGKLISQILVLDNKSEVMYDYSLIPPEQIKQ